jgi:hypothetical protein
VMLRPAALTNTAAWQVEQTDDLVLAAFQSAEAAALWSLTVIDRALYLRWCACPGTACPRYCGTVPSLEPAFRPVPPCVHGRRREHPCVSPAATVISRISGQPDGSSIQQHDPLLWWRSIGVATAI